MRLFKARGESSRALTSPGGHVTTVKAEEEHILTTWGPRDHCEG